MTFRSSDSSCSSQAIHNGHRAVAAQGQLRAKGAMQRLTRSRLMHGLGGVKRLGLLQNLGTFQSSMRA